MSKIPSRSAAPGRDVPAGIEPVRLIRGASRGFSVLAIGGAVQPLVSLIYSPLGYVWLVLVAVVAFAVAAWRAHEVPTPLIQGAASATGAYALILPLVVMGAGRLPWDQATLTTLTALVVGAATGGVRARRVDDRKGDQLTPVGGCSDRPR